MAQTHFLTLAALREVDPQTFDGQVRTAVKEAAEIVGQDVVLKALANTQPEQMAIAA